MVTLAARMRLSDESRRRRGRDVDSLRRRARRDADVRSRRRARAVGISSATIPSSRRTPGASRTTANAGRRKTSTTATTRNQTRTSTSSSRPRAAAATESGRRCCRPWRNSRARRSARSSLTSVRSTTTKYFTSRATIPCSRSARSASRTTTSAALPPRGRYADGSRRCRGCDVDSLWRRVAATPRPRRGHPVETGSRLRYGQEARQLRLPGEGRGFARSRRECFSDESRRRRGHDADSPW